jgi:DNA-binding NarL/FixJ family response regulator
MMKRQIRILLADDHPLIREGIDVILRDEEALTLVGVATDGYETRRLAVKLQPDVLLLDLKMPGPSPLETVAAVSQNCPDTRLLVLSAHENVVPARTLLREGISGYVLKDEANETLVHAIQAVARGGTWFSQAVARQLARRAQTEPDFTDRERDVLRLLARGWRNKRIAGELDITERTVRFHLNNIYRKIGVESRGEAIVWAVQAGYGRE